MRQGLIYLAPIALIASGIAFGGAACSSSPGRNVFQNEVPDGSVGEGGTGFTPGKTPCAGLDCKRVDCDAAPTASEIAELKAAGKSQEDIDEMYAERKGKKTTITGKVFDPAGANALYGAVVYIPKTDADLEPISASIDDGVQCQTCDSVVLDPMISTLTDTTGSFTLENVPIDKDVPVVIQIGKWRRKLHFDVTKTCAENKVPDKEFRLPKNGTEGDMPHIAVTAGGCDALECLLRGIGIDDKEFVAGADPKGHVHVFNGDGGNFPGGPKAGGDATNAFGGELWNATESLSKYDLVMMSCECSEENENKGGDVGRPGARQAMWDYANAGGRIFATHYHYTWFKNSPQMDWQNVANWTSSSASGTFEVDQSFPKGAAFADWLVSVNASSSKGSITLTDVTNSLSNVNAPAQSWIKKGDNAVRYFSFNTPTGEAPENQCGRAVYSDLHLMGISAGGKAFPDGCPAPGGLSAQQKALEFMFFDLSGCVQSDDKPPVVPK